MKKGIIVTAILFIVSSLLVVISAVALGASGISQLVGYLRSDDSTEFRQNAGEFAQRIADGAELFGEKIQEGAEEFADSNDLFDGRDFSIIGNPDLQIAGDMATSIDISDKDEILIRADVASVVIKTTDDRFMSASADTYSKSNLASGNEYELLIDENGYDIHLKSDKHLKNSVCELTVEIPEDYKGKVTVSVDVGSIEFDEATFENLEASVAVGDIDADLLSVNRAKFSVDTGNLEIGKNFFCFGGFEAKVQIGEVSYTLPQGRLVNISYSVATGGVETDDVEEAGFEVTSTMEAGFDGVNTSGKISGSYSGIEDNNSNVVDTVLTAKIEVGIGSIEFDVQ